MPTTKPKPLSERARWRNQFERTIQETAHLRAKTELVELLRERAESYGMNLAGLYEAGKSDVTMLADIPSLDELRQEHEDRLRAEHHGLDAQAEQTRQEIEPRFAAVLGATQRLSQRVDLTQLTAKQRARIVERASELVESDVDGGSLPQAADEALLAGIASEAPDIFVDLDRSGEIERGTAEKVILGKGEARPPREESVVHDYSALSREDAGRALDRMGQGEAAFTAQSAPPTVPTLSQEEMRAMSRDEAAAAMDRQAAGLPVVESGTDAATGE